MSAKQEMKATPEKAPRERLTREDWLQRAMEVLSKDGDSKIRIDSICRDLGVTKGSFYWHFKNRADFLNSIVDYWYLRYNVQVPELVELQGGTAQERLQRIFEMVTSGGLAHYDGAFDSWAAHEPTVSEKVRKAYRARFEYTCSLFREMGFRGIELETRACAFLGFMMSEWRLQGKENSKRSRARALKELEFFFRK